VIQTEVTVVHKEALAPAWWRLTLAAPDLTPRLSPGQFLLVRCADPFTCYLRRPIFPARVIDDQFELLVRPDPDPGRAWLTARQPGDRLDVIGPLGSGFPLAAQTRNLLLAGDEPALGPLLGQLDRALAAGAAVTLALGGTRASTLYPVAQLPPVVEFQAATLDGSLGHRGRITDLLPDLLRWADAVCLVGSLDFCRTVRAQAESVRFIVEAGFLSVLMTNYPMACGLGACLSCTIEMKAGLKLTCLDGPVFDLMQLSL
jgi:dihydroorotate dehydrogenase electron transfer subunit